MHRSALLLACFATSLVLTLFCDVTASMRPLDGELPGADGDLDSQQHGFGDVDDGETAAIYKKQKEMMSAGMWPEVNRYESVFSGRVKPRMHLFVGRRAETAAAKRRAPVFVGKKSSLSGDDADEIIDDEKRSRMFVGKRYRAAANDDDDDFEEDEKRGRMFVGKRRGPIFVGKRSAD